MLVIALAVGIPVLTVAAVGLFYVVMVLNNFAQRRFNYYEVLHKAGWYETVGGRLLRKTSANERSNDFVNVAHAIEFTAVTSTLDQAISTAVRTIWAYKFKRVMRKQKNMYSPEQYQIIEGIGEPEYLDTTKARSLLEANFK